MCLLRRKCGEKGREQVTLIGETVDHSYPKDTMNTVDQLISVTGLCLLECDQLHTVKNLLID